VTVREIVAWALAGGGAVGVGAAIPLAVRAFGQARLVGSMPPTPLPELDAGLHEVSGTLHGDVPRVAPATERPCVWVRVLVEQQQGNRWETLLDVRQGGPARIEQGGTAARLDLAAADVAVFSGTRVKSGSLRAPSAELDAMVARIPGASLSATPEGPFVRWREEILADGDTAYVVGTARKGEDGTTWELVREERELLGVFDHDSTEVVRYLQRNGRRWILTSVVSLAVLAWGLWMVAPDLLGGQRAGPPPTAGRPPATTPAPGEFALGNGAAVPPPAQTAGAAAPSGPAPSGTAPAGAAPTVAPAAASGEAPAPPAATPAPTAP
jgi:hypothetical protein